MKKEKKPKKRPNGQATTTTPDANRAPSPPVDQRPRPDAPDPDSTAEFKAGKDL